MNLEAPEQGDLNLAVDVTGTCDWGGCDQDAVAERYDEKMGWLPVCTDCAFKPEGREMPVSEPVIGLCPDPYCRICKDETGEIRDGLDDQPDVEQHAQWVIDRWGHWSVQMAMRVGPLEMFGGRTTEVTE